MCSERGYEVFEFEGSMTRQGKFTVDTPHGTAWDVMPECGKSDMLCCTAFVQLALTSPYASDLVHLNAALMPRNLITLLFFHWILVQCASDQVSGQEVI